MACFHPKCLYAETEAGNGWVLAGSGNLTRGGKEANVEAGLLVSGPRTLRALRDARHVFVELTEVAVPLSEHLLGAIRTAQEERQQVAVSTEARLPHLPDLDPLLLLPLLPAQQQIRSSACIVFNNVAVAVRERRRDLSILRALGCRSGAAAP